jgi:uncharacterized OB-fold protein
LPVGPIDRDPPSAPFFDGTARGELLLRACTGCRHRMEPAAAICSRCGSRELDWRPASGRGTVVSWTVVHSRAGEGAGEGVRRTPVAIVELAEGPWLEAQLVDVAPDDVVGAMPVLVGFERADGGEALPVFRPEGSG